MKWICLIVAAVAVISSSRAIAGQDVVKGDAGFVLMASTIGPIDAGIVGELEDAFQKETGIVVRHVGAGTGEALKIAEKGEVDLVMVHARSLEEKFVAAGYGTERIDLMYNDFVILGPAADPAHIAGIKTAADALKAISGAKATFVTRGDNSGTHMAEKELWAKAGIKPDGTWYVTYEKGSQGNAPTLKFANEKGAYTVMDRATYLMLQREVSLAVLVEKDPPLINYISLIPVNPKKARRDSYETTMRFVRWLTAADRGQRIIARFGIDRFGSPLFFPNSAGWKQSLK